ncbi:MAG TPA: S8 family serine peptidase [Verrucomicrobiae bacterium]|jgi:hypothetical protein|nr:S8 family serine peptidase [Verrucomicrobiae bacterium]
MKNQTATAWALGALLCAAGLARATDLDTIGLTRLLTNQPGLTGAGIRVAQAESGNGTPSFEINPAAISEPVSLFTWISSNGTASTYPNDVGTVSDHADGVALNFFAPGAGVAPGVSHVDNYDADYFIETVIDPNLAIPDTVVNQSFVDFSLADQDSLNSSYDDYVATHGTIICSAVGNGGDVYPPSSAYNVIAVGCYGVGASSSVGPTTDNGRSKPDLIAPSLATSFSTPYVSGSAAVLLQAAGANASAQNARTIKALLVNGAIKPFNWAHPAPAPLDPLYGAGLLNIYYSYTQLAGGAHAFSANNSAATPLYANPIAAPAGWDYETIGSSSFSPTVNHYCFGVTNGDGFTFTATLVWQRALAASGINALTLSLYNVDTAALVAQSASAVDNVQHLYVPRLASGRYDLQMARAANLTPVSDAAALAYQFFPIAPLTLSLQRSGTNLTLSWPATPTIYTLQQTASFSPPIAWTAVTNWQWLANGLVTVNLTTNASPAFYRLLR